MENCIDYTHIEMVDKAEKRRRGNLSNLKNFLLRFVIEGAEHLSKTK
ncbi:hypothetical protein [Flagellimonas ochracea]|nr:hypothetical protein [Allomuricauda ochracea]